MKTSLEAASKPDEPALVTALFARRLAQPIAVAAVKCGIPANAVTVAGGLCWVLSLPIPVFALLARGDMRRICAVWLAAAFLWCAGYVLDVADGSVARMTGSSSRSGFFLDYVFHLLFKPAFLFSVGLGVAATWTELAACTRSELPEWFLRLRFFVVGSAMPLAVLSIPANGAAATCAAERTLCGEVEKRHLKMAGASAPGLWLGSDDVSAPASRKRGSFWRTSKTLAAEITSYYLQGPFFAALVAADCALAALASVPFFPLTTAGFLLLSLVLALRIPLRFRREWNRLGRATRCGRAGRAVLGVSVRLRAVLALLPALPAIFFAVFRDPSSCAVAFVAAWTAAAALESLAENLSRRAGNPVHNRYFALASETAWMPAGVASAMASVFGSFPAAALAPLAAVAFAAAESGAAAHVFCQDIGKGKLREDSPESEKNALLARNAHEPMRFVAALEWIFPAALAADAALCDTRFSGAAMLAVSAAAVLSLPVRVRRTMRAIAGRA